MRAEASALPGTRREHWDLSASVPSVPVSVIGPWPVDAWQVPHRCGSSILKSLHSMEVTFKTKKEAGHLPVILTTLRSETGGS